MTQHTPGPWKVSEFGLTNSGQKAVIYYPDNKEDETKHICFVSCQADFKHGKGYVAECSVREANARLIAAAPELLEALERLLSFDCVRWLNDRGPIGEGWQSDELIAAIAAADEAIAKAR